MVEIENAYQRGKKGIWQFRMRIPKEVQGFYKKRKYIFESLGTPDPFKAKGLADALTEKYKAEFDAYREGSAPKVAVNIHGSKHPNLVDLVDTGFVDRCLAMHANLDTLDPPVVKHVQTELCRIHGELQRALSGDNGLSVDFLKGINLKPLIDTHSNLYDLCLQTSGKQDLSDNKHLRNRTARATIDLLKQVIRKIADIIPSILGLGDDADNTPLYRQANTVNALTEGNWPPHVNHSPTQQVKVVTNEKPAPVLSTVLEGCLGEKKRGAVTVDSLRSSVGLLIEWYEDDKPISFYTRERMKSFVDDCLLHLPPNRKKVKKWQAFKLKEIVTKTKPQDLIAPDTMHNILSDLTTVFTYAVDEYDEFISKHPTLKLSAKLPEKDDDVDRSFPDEELKIILNNLEYNPEWPSRYWVVMLGFFTGARLNELCQLHLNDIKKADDFYYISINIDDADETFKRVKNKPSRRTVPIHPKMIEIGFMNYIKQRSKDSKGDNKQLFPELVYKEKSGYGRQMGDWLRRYRKNLKIMNPVNRGFHGFRHTFIMWAQNKAEMSDREILELTGHENKAISKDHRRYSHALTAKRLNTQLVKLDYGLPMPSNPYMEAVLKES